MKRWGLGVGCAAAMLAVSMPVSAGTTYAGSTGVVTGTITYDSPLPELMSTCKWKLGYDIRLDSPAFVFRDGEAASVGAMAFVGRGITTCASESLEGGRIDGSLTFAARPDLDCRVTGHYTRVLTDLSWVATTFCTVGGVTRAATWFVRLQKFEGTLAGVMSNAA